MGNRPSAPTTRVSRGTTIYREDDAVRVLRGRKGCKESPTSTSSREVPFSASTGASENDTAMSDDDVSTNLGSNQKTDTTPLANLPSFTAVNAAFDSDFKRRTPPKVNIDEMRRLFELVFCPESGQLEVLASGFITIAQYQECGAFLDSFLSSELSEVWVGNRVLLSVAGGEHLIPQRGMLSDAEFKNRLARLRWYAIDALRSTLLNMSGIAKTGTASCSCTSPGSLRRLLQSFRAHQQTMDRDYVTNSKTHGLSDGDDYGKWFLQDFYSRTHTGSRGSSSHNLVNGQLLRPWMDNDSVHVSRIRASASLSFDCLDLLARRIPATLVSTMNGNYFSGSTPVVFTSVAYRNSLIGDVTSCSFFVSLQERAQLLRGIVDGAQPYAAKAAVGSADALSAALTNIGLVLSAALSSTLTFAIFHLADAVRMRGEYRELKKKAELLNVTVEKMLGRPPAKWFSGKTTNLSITQLKEFVMTGDMSLTTLTQNLVIRYRKEQANRLEKLRRAHPNLFLYMEAVSDKEREEFDPSRALGNVTLKLMHLVAGGLRSIEADDRRIPYPSRPAVDDLLLNRMLQVPLLSAICPVAYMLGLPAMVGVDALLQKKRERPWSYVELDECTGVLRELFQSVGALPSGSKCPHELRLWLHQFPLYAVDTEGKRILMYLYCSQAAPMRTLPIAVQKDMVLRSFAQSLCWSEVFSRTEHAAYVLLPRMVMGNVKQFMNNSINLVNANFHRKSKDNTLGIILGPKEKEYLRRSVENTECNDEDNDVASDCSSVSTLLDEDLNIDVYSCITPCAQLYLRASEEAARRENHRATDLTPFVRVEMFPTPDDLKKQRREVYLTCSRYLSPDFLPYDGLMLVRWTTRDPMVTFQSGDILEVEVSCHGDHLLSDSFYDDFILSNCKSPSSDRGNLSPEDPTLPQGQMVKHVGCRWVVMDVVGARSVSTPTSSCLQPTSLQMEVVLRVQSDYIPFAEVLCVYSLSHSRDGSSPFRYLYGGDSCWTDPKLGRREWGATSQSMSHMSEAEAYGQHLGRGGSLTPHTYRPNASPRQQQCTLGSRTSREELLHTFYALGVLLANAIPNALFLSMPLPPLAFVLLKRATATQDHTFRNFLWQNPSDGNLLSPALILNAAYEIVSMSDLEYYRFLESRELANPAHLVFPVRQSIAEEWEFALLAPTRPEGTHNRSTSVTFKSKSVVASDVSLRQRYTAVTHLYLKALRTQNRSGLMFSGQSHQPIIGIKTPYPPPQAPESSTSTNLRHHSADSSDEKLQLQKLLSQLPSRLEYISLYLVNDVAWGSVRANGHGSVTTRLWGCLAKGFMTSPMSRSPLMEQCSARVIREVLCGTGGKMETFNTAKKKR